MVENNARSVFLKSLTVVYIVLGLIATGMCFLLFGAAQNTLYGPVGLSSVVAILIGVRRDHPRYTSPRYALAGAFYSVGYLIFAAGSVLLARTRDPEAGPASLAYVIIVPIGVKGDRV